MNSGIKTPAEESGALSGKPDEAHRSDSEGGRSRDDWTRTSGLFVPNEARYRAALHPEWTDIQQNGCYMLNRPVCFLYETAKIKKSSE